MKILANRQIKKLFLRAAICILMFILTSMVFIHFEPAHAAAFIFLCALCMVLAILAAGCGYFRGQNLILEHAALRITEYISGDSDARIECDEDGELYRLFHEVNTLVSILNAHAKKEWEEKEFLKNTISDISHQLKTPLAALNIYNGILKEEAEDSQTIQEFAKLSEQELDRIETLVQNLLKITKLDAGTIILDKHSEQVSELMENVKKHFSFRAEQEGKELTLSGNDDVVLTCDRSWLLEALDNIVKNALDHTTKGDTVRMEWSQSASAVQIIISDTGSGIHPEDLYHIFKRFYRSRFSQDTQGIGLGLPLAKSIIEAHNGTIEADSEFGAGTSFVICFFIPTKL